MIIFTRTYDLLRWLLPKSETFPVLYRRTVTERMMAAALDLHDALCEAQSQGGTTRQKHLRTADAALDKLRMYLRLAHHWHWLSDGQYRHVSGMVAEIGRLLGGWIKASK
jgi:hypothetical protein